MAQIEGPVLLWVGAPDEQLALAFEAHGLQVARCTQSDLPEAAVRIAPDLIVLDDGAKDAESWTERLAIEPTASGSPIIAVTNDGETNPRARSRFGLVARLARGQGPDAIATQLVALTQSLLRRAPRWRTTTGAAHLES